MPAMQPHRLVLALMFAYPVYATAQTDVPAIAASTALSYQLAAGPLDTTLLSIARRTGQPISFDPALVRGAQSAAVNGSFTGTQAVEEALKGAPDLALMRTANGTMTIVRRPSVSRASPTASHVAAVVGAAAPAADGIIPNVEVVGQIDSAGRGFSAVGSRTITRTATPLSKVPQSIAVVPQDVITSQQAQDMQDILRNASGVVYVPANSQGAAAYLVRGYQVANTMSDGLADNGIAATPTAGIESVEVLKGPSAILAGDAPAGGFVNVIKKKPTAERIATLRAEYGSYQDSTLSGDFGGALTQDKQWRYRLNLSGGHAGDGNGTYTGKRNTYVAPVLGYRSAATELAIGGEYYRQTTPISAYTYAPFRGGEFLEVEPGVVIPLVDAVASNRAMGRVGAIGPDGNSVHVTGKRAYYTLDHKVNDTISLVSKAQYINERTDFHSWSLQGAPGQFSDVAASTLILNGDHQAYSGQSYENYARVKLQMGALSHTLVGGWAYSRANTRQDSVGYDPVAYDITRPNSAAVNAITARPTGDYGDYETTRQQSGLFLQDQLRWGRWTALVAIRRDHAWSSSGGSQYYAFLGEARELPGSGYDQSAWSPSAGIVYQLAPWATVYANYLRGIEAGGYKTASGSLLAPSRSMQYEAGVKLNLLEDQATFSASAFRIKKPNVPVSAGYANNEFFYVQGPGQTSQGIETDLAGRIAPGWDAIATYTYTNSKSNSEEFDHVVTGVPRHVFSLWNTYRLQSPAAKGWGVGIGLYARDGFYASYTELERLRIAGQMQADASIFYEHKNWSLTLGVKNMFDRTLYQTGSFTSAYIPLAPQRNYRLTLSYQL